MEIGLPIKPFERPGIREQVLRIGEKADWGKVEWAIAELGPNKAREFNGPTILVDPGEHTIQYADVGKNRKAAAINVTGALKFRVE